MGSTDNPDNKPSSKNFPFQLTYTPMKVYTAVSENVELRCARNLSVPSNIYELLRIRIMKKTDNKKWSLVAEIRDKNSPVEVHGNVTGCGNIATINDSYLSVTWPVATAKTFGAYKCLAVGIDKEAFFKADETSLVEIKADNLLERQLFNLILESNKNIRKNISENSRLINKTAEAADEYSARTETDLLDIKSKINGVNNAFQTLAKDILFPNEEDIWPAGTYGLLKPNTGCPVSLAFYGGSTGYFQIHTESSKKSNGNKYSHRSHLARPIETSYSINMFLTLRFCLANGIFNTGVWPDGRYCIHKKGNCPASFNYGYIQIDTEDSGNQDDLGGNTPDKSPTYLEFCCRTTGNPNSPIKLPTAYPFYLYQYDGRCQEVYGMNATEEFVQIDTEAGNKKSGSHPYIIEQAGGLIRLELCYYTKF
ncbi:Apextrin [Plakobranchus ocellatus]|uniref:Apextrin n=1 Tax=Plakobranchus ocellatus TaxID=259542 RepID=A0AAV4CYQ9_9GAST|nr:Apextrin [Plakobranchus ocellatus]